MGFGQTLVAVVAIMALASVLRALLGGGHSRQNARMMQHLAQMAPQPDPDADRLRDEVRGLKERVAVLERLITDQSSSLEREFEKLKSID